MGGAAGPGGERRAYTRVNTRFDVHCRRLGRGGVDEDVAVIDLSMGGMRIEGSGALQTGDVVELTLLEPGTEVVLCGLVVGNSPSGAGRSSHIAFTRQTPTTLEQIGQLVDSLTGA